MLRRESVTDQHRTAANQQSAGGDDAADAMIHWQAIVHAILGPGIHQTREPQTPFQKPPMTDIGGLWQTGRTGRIDQKRPISDRHDAPLRCRQGCSRESLDPKVDAVEFASGPVSMGPQFGPVRQLHGRGRELFRKPRSHNDMLRRDDIDAMRKCRTAKLRVDQRNDDADAGQAEPYRHIFRPIRHHQADGFTRSHFLIERPACVGVGALGERAISQAFADGKQRRRVAAGLRQFLDDSRKEATRIGGDRRSRFESTNPIAECSVLVTRLLRRFRLYNCHRSRACDALHCCSERPKCHLMQATLHRLTPYRHII